MIPRGFFKDLHRSPGSDPLEKGARWIKRVAVKKAEQRLEKADGIGDGGEICGWVVYRYREEQEEEGKEEGEGDPPRFALFAWKKRSRLQNTRRRRRRRRKIERLDRREEEETLIVFTEKKFIVHVS